MTKNSVMVVGQVPPPWHGQALAIKQLVDSKFNDVDLHFVPMKFSQQIDHVGRFRWRKLGHLPLLIIRIWITRFRTNCNVLYYPPGGTTTPAIIRDIAVLLSCRLLFRRVVFHSHAGGFVAVAENTPLPVRLLARVAYAKPDLLIQLTESSPPDGALTKAKEVVYVPYGLPDEGARYEARMRGAGSIGKGKVNLLFVGAVSYGKGIMVLLGACAHLKDNGFEFLLRVVGRFYPPEFEAECNSFIEENGLEDFVHFVGVLTGDAKWELYTTSHIFCFPTFYIAENQPLVILEAMQFGLPCVASDWRSVATMVEDNETGFLVPINNSVELAERIAHLIERPELQEKMGARAREIYLQKYTDAAWRPAMESALKSV